MAEQDILKTVYYVRHGESRDNVSPVFQSERSPLSERGQAQAEATAERLSHLAFEALISSPLPRAKETAQRIGSRTGKDPEFSELFVERVKPSRVNGKPWDDEEAAAIYKKWTDTLYTSGVRVEDGENFDDTVVRADQAQKFLEARPETTLAVVTHGYFLRVILAGILVGERLDGPIMRQFQASAEMENTGITVLQYAKTYERDYAWRLWTYNDHSHFAE